MSSIKKFFDSKNKLMAIVIPSDYESKGIDFITANEDYQQIAIMSHPAGHEIIRHYHNYVPRTIDFTTETLIIKKGTLTARLYEDNKLSHVFQLKQGDIVALISGGHGFVVDEDVSMIEIKQGPYIGQEDKTRF